MKMMKLALLGGAALAVTTAGARADDLSSMKAEIEALNARVAQLETAPAVPAGYQLMTMSSGDATVVPGNADSAKFGSQVSKVTKISVLPTADAPAAATIEWSGYVRAIVGYHDHREGTVVSTHTNTNTNFHVTADGAVTATKTTTKTQTKRGGNSHENSLTARGQLKVVAKTDTSVGEVGVRLNIRGDSSVLGGETGKGVNATLRFHEMWGWWAMTPELTLGAGYSGSLGNVGYGYDGACTCYGTDNAGVDFNSGDATQMRLTYASGPLSIAAALENSNGGGELGGAPGKQNLGVAGQVAYKGDTVNGAVDAFWHNNNGGDDPYGVGAGLGFSLGDMASLSVGAQFARTNWGADRYGVSALASMNLSDAVHAEVAGGYRHYNHSVGENWGVLAGVYYAPVKQLTIGLEGEYAVTAKGLTASGLKAKDTYIDLVTVFAF